MTRPRLLTGALAVMLSVAPACNRAETNQEARETAAEVKEAASRAGDRLADSWLTTKVQAQYFADDDIKSRYINVTTREGVVTLKGFVESEEIRQEALQIAKNTDGVRQINDQLAIGQPPRDAFDRAPDPDTVATGGSDATADPASDANVVDDALITTRIQAKYFLDPGVKNRSIEVDTANGVVTLRGLVASDNERAQALLLARTTQGVQRVEDSLTVDASLAQPSSAPRGPDEPGPQASTDASGAVSGGVGTGGARTEDTSVESALKTKLSGDAQLKAASIDVSARDGVVLLQGTVPNQATKQRVLSTARETEGVVQIVDRLTVK